jgi:hypothetical protein
MANNHPTILPDATISVLCSTADRAGVTLAGLVPTLHAKISWLVSSKGVGIAWRRSDPFFCAALVRHGSDYGTLPRQAVEWTSIATGTP